MNKTVPLSFDNQISAEQPLRILIAEDNEMDQLLIKRALKKSEFEYTLECVNNREDYVLRLKDFVPHIILCDFSMPQFGALEALKILHEENLNIPLIIVTGTLTDEMAVECLKQGATDYIIKDKIVRLPAAIKMALDLDKSKKEKVDVEHRLRQSEKQLKVITDVIPALLAYISTDYRVQFCNQLGAEWFGPSVIGLHIEEIFGADVYRQIQLCEIRLRGGQQCSFESRLTGRKTPQFVNITLVPDAEKNKGLKGYVCLVTDITDSKIYENELKAAKKEADAANKAKSQFLANMSHEIRTPLNAIMGLSELLLSDQNNPEKTLWLQKIVRNSEHLKKIINEILDLSKIEAGKMQLQMAPFSLTKTISRVKSMLAPLAHEKSLKLVFEIEGSIPDTIVSDEDKLEHIFLNILGNAIKFSSKGRVMLRASLNKGDGALMHFTITDNGLGMSADQAKHLFEPFTQVDSSSTRRFGGTGLGLALAKQMAQALGGDVYLEKSAPGEGSTFVVTLDPGAFNPSPQITSFNTTFIDHHQDADTGTNTAENLNGLSVLLVEDSVDNQFLLQHFLEKAGVDVDVASDGQEGLQKALAGDHDLILMDLQMPVMDGYTATSTLRLRGYNKTIVAFTAHSYQEERDRCLKIGFDDFLSKPVKRKELISCIAKYKNLH